MSRQNYIYVFSNFFKHASIYSVSNLLERIIGILLIPIYLSKLSPAEFGLAEFVLVFTSLTSIIVPLGIQHATSRFLVYDKLDRRSVLGTGYVSILLSTSLITLLLLFFSDYITKLLLDSNDYLFLYKIGIGIIVFSVLGSFHIEILRMDNKSVLLGSLKLLMTVVKLLSICFFIIALSWKAEGILLGNLLGWTIPATLSFSYFAYLKSFDRSLLTKYIKFGVPMVFHKISSQLLNTGDRIVIKLFLGMEAVGIYSLAYKVGNIVCNASMPLQAAYTPFVLREADKADGPKKLSIGGSLYIVYSFLIGLSLVIFAPSIIKWLAKSIAFHNAINIVPLIVLGSLFHVYYAITAFGIILREKTNYLPLISILSGLINIVFNLILIPIIGLYGAATATVISYLLMWQVGYQINKKLYKMQYISINLCIAFSVSIIIVISLIKYNYIPH